MSPRQRRAVLSCFVYNYGQQACQDFMATFFWASDLIYGRVSS